MTRGDRPKGLGRGLSALMADVQPPAEAPPAPDRTVPLDRIEPNPDQPRRRFTEDALEDLARSIREKGVIQPLVVRVSPRDPGRHEIVAGERRWRAARMAGLSDVPVIVRDLGDAEVLEIAIVENVQRADLNPIEEAAGYRQLIDRFGHTQERLAEALGKSRSHIANLMRLLQLPDEVREMVAGGALSAGHARALITRPDAAALADEVVRRGLSVRETEQLAKAPPAAARPTPSVVAATAPSVLESDMSAALGMRVEVQRGRGGRGRLTLHFASQAQLDDLCVRLVHDVTPDGRRDWYRS